MSASKRKMCERKLMVVWRGAGVLLILASVFTSGLTHKMGHVEPVPKENNNNNNHNNNNNNGNQKGVSTITMTRRLIEPDTSSSSGGGDGLFGTRINQQQQQQQRHSSTPLHHHHPHHRNPSVFMPVKTGGGGDGSRRGDEQPFLPHHYFRNHNTTMGKLSPRSEEGLVTGTGGSSTTHRSSPARSIAPLLTSSKKNILESAGVEEEREKNVRGEMDDFRSNMMGGFLKREVWTIPLLSIAAINIFLISLFEIYVLCKARGPSRRHLFLGQMLLFGLFLCSSLALVFAICPSAVSCFLGRLGLGIAYTLIFSVLMVKCIFLLSLDGGIYLPASYQACLLLFSVLVQVAIDTQWVIVYPPYLKVNPVGGPLWPQCGTSYTHLLLTLSYNVFLICIVGVLAFKTRGIRENYRESTYIGISVLVTIPIWISWTIAGWILQGRHQDACVAFGLLAQSLAIFLIMFMPKGRQLAAMGKEGMYLEDQEDQCSGYSPSFFHFKPSKSYKTALIGDALSNGHFYRFINDYNAQFYYPPPSSADGNVYTTLEPTISTINPNVFFHRSDFHPGMIY